MGNALATPCWAQMHSHDISDVMLRGSAPDRSPAGTRRLVADLARPYRGWLVIILLAMMVETATSLAGPWPLKIVIDNAVGHHAAPEWVARLLGPALVANGPALAAVAALSLVLLAALGGLASYIDSYYTESVGQWVANDLRMRVYDHLERLSFNYYDTHQTGLLLSTMTDDVSTVQDFVSSATLSILVDFMTIVGMLGLMFWLNWDFTLLVVAITPFLLLFVDAVQASGQEGDARSAAPRERHRRPCSRRVSNRCEPCRHLARRTSRRRGSARRAGPR